MTATATASADGWEDPIPFRDGDRPPFPTEHLPASLGRFADAAAASLQVPVDVVAFAVLGVASAAVAGKVSVSLNSDRTEPANLWLASVLGSGERKSAAFTTALAPLREWERETAAGSAVDVARDQSRFRTLAKELATAEDRAAKGDDGARDQRDDLAGQIARLRPAELFQLIVADATPESLAAVLAAQGGRAALVTDEAAGMLDVMRGRYSKDGRSNLDVYLQSFSGSEVRVNRKGHPPIYLPRPCLTIATTMQPGVLADAGAEPEMIDRGLLPRFLWALPDSRVGFRAAESPSIPVAVRDLYRHLVRALCEFPERRDDDRQLVAELVPIDTNAARLLAHLRAEVEIELRPGGRFEHVREWAMRIEGAVARLALVLHLWNVAQDAEARCDPLPSPVPAVTAEAVAAAVAIMREFLIPHGLAAFARMGANPATSGAKRIHAWIVRNRAETFSTSDAHRGNEHWAQRVADLAEPLRVLEEWHYIRPVNEERPTSAKGGRPPSPRWEVNPAVLATCRENRENRGNP